MYDVAATVVSVRDKPKHSRKYTKVTRETKSSYQTINLEHKGIYLDIRFVVILEEEIL